MDMNNYVFTPAAGPPTAKKIQKVIIQFIGVITIVCMVTLLSRSTLWGLGLICLIWVSLCTVVLFICLTNIYIINIRINPEEGMLYFSFMNYKGEITNKSIDIKQAKYSYKVRASMYRRFDLVIQDKLSKLKISETTSENRNQANVFFRNQLDEINQLILQIQGQNDHPDRRM